MWLVCLQSVSRGGCWDLATSSEALLQNLGGGPQPLVLLPPPPWPFRLTQPPPALLGVEQRRFGAEQPRRAGEKGWVAVRWRESLKRRRTQALSLGGGVLLRRSCPQRDSSQAQRLGTLRVYSVPRISSRRGTSRRLRGFGCKDAGLRGLGTYLTPYLPPAFTSTLPNVCQARGLWFCRVLPGALVISLGLSFLQPFLGRRGVLALSATSAEVATPRAWETRADWCWTFRAEQRTPKCPPQTSPIEAEMGGYQSTGRQILLIL